MHQPGKAGRITLRGELALTAAIIINSFAVAVTVYAALGISPVSSFPYALSLVLPFLSLGTWTYLFQGSLVVVLMFLQKKFIPTYLFSFLVGFAFGTLLDVFAAWLPVLPDSLPWRILYFALSCPMMGIGIALENRCKLPILPADLFTRELSRILGIKFSSVKTTMDLTCTGLAIVLTVCFTGALQGIGIGTVIGALCYGRLGGFFGELIDRRFDFVSVLEP